MDDATWLFHLWNQDYSRWLREVIKDLQLADEVQPIENEGEDSAKRSRDWILEAIERHYTGAA